MARSTLLETDTVTLEQLFSNGTLYRVPLYQRDYAWDREQWEDLWLDILENQAAPQPHFMGAIVLQRRGGFFHVIDGQQRMATLSILCVAVLNRLRAFGNKDDDRRADLLMAQYVGAADPASLRWSSKLALNESDDTFYQEFIVNNRKPASESKLSGSTRRLWEAVGFFTQKLEAHLPKDTEGQKLVEFFVERVGRQLLFTRITVEDELNAYAVFETLNARNLQLTSTDLLKNYLFSLFKGETDLKQARHQWSRIIGTVEVEGVPDFLRHYLGSKQPIVRAERLFKVLKQSVQSREQAFELLDALERSAIWYRALNDPNDELWTGSMEQCRQHVRALRLFQVAQHKPLALACFEKKLGAGDLERILRACLVISFRHTIIGRRNPSTLETPYNQAAIRTTAAAAPTARDVIDELRPIYLSDDDFVVDFARADLPTSGKRARLAKYVLSRLEAQMGGPDEDFEFSPATVEHILPESLTEPWMEQFDEETHARFVSRLGNLTLLERDLNKDIGAAGFQEKRAAYEKSKYTVTRAIEAAEWTTEAIIARQRRLAVTAKTVWRIDFPS